MLTAVVSVIILLLCGAVVVTIAKDRGPGPDDAAVSYEYAWDRLDFASLFSLSAAELRDGLDRKQFVAAKKRACVRPAHGGSVGLVEAVVADNDVAVHRALARDRHGASRRAARRLDRPQPWPIDLIRPDGVDGWCTGTRSHRRRRR